MTIEILKHISILKRDLANITDSVSRHAVGATQAALEQDSVTASEIIQTIPDTLAALQDIENQSLSILTDQRPVSADLRYLTALLKAAWDLKRIIEIVRALAAEALLPARNFEKKHSAAIEQFAHATVRLLRRTVDGLTDVDSCAIESVHETFDQLREEQDAFLAQLRNQHDPSALDAYLLALHIVRSLNRIQEHATGIAGDALQMLRQES